jgi:hypothetical protein
MPCNPPAKQFCDRADAPVSSNRGSGGKLFATVGII